MVCVAQGVAESDATEGLLRHLGLQDLSSRPEVKPEPWQ